MKKHISSMQTILFLVLGLAINNIASAQTAKDTNSFISTAVVKHIPNQEDLTIFQVKLANEGGERFSISIKDDLGTSLFQEVFQDKEFDKKFQFESLG